LHNDTTIPILIQTLSRERKEILDQQKGLKDKLDEISREFAAIDAYAAAKTGKAATPTRPRRGPKKSGPSPRQSSAEVRSRATR
jgi:hypothetical protein